MRDRAKDQPGLHMAAQEVCVTRLTNGFCMPRNSPQCKCWDVAEQLMRSSALSAQGATWVFAHRTWIEEQAKREYQDHIAFRADAISTGAAAVPDKANTTVQHDEAQAK